MSLERAKNDFLNILRSLEPDQRLKLKHWIQSDLCADSIISDSYFHLRTIAEDIKTMVPLNAILPSENIVNQTNGATEPSLHVDSFLFDDDDIDSLVEEGKLSRNYCRDCSSLNVAPINFISHSSSIERIIFVFKYLIPNLENKVVLDVGSRLGAVLYGAYYCSSAKKIIGVEFNEDMCKLQQFVIKKYNMQDRIEVICSDIRKVPEIVHAANVVILNNVFECFMTNEEQRQTWLWLRNHLSQSGTMLITIPSMEETLSTVQTGIDISTWLQRIPIVDPIAQMKLEDQDLISEVCAYVVK